MNIEAKMKKFIRIISTSILVLVLLLSTVSSFATNAEDHNIMLTSSSVQKRTYGDIVYYECTDGTCFGYMPETGICWVRCGNSWYGLDNSEGVFDAGSKFWLKRISRSDGQEYDNLYGLLDDSHKGIADYPDILAFGVQDEDGAEYTLLEGPATFYIQCGSDWNMEDFEAYYISSGGDETLGHIFKPVGEPVNGTCAVLSLNHLGSCLLFGTNNSVGSIISNNPCGLIIIVGVAAIVAAIIIIVCKKKVAK